MSYGGSLRVRLLTVCVVLLLSVPCHAQLTIEEKKPSQNMGVLYRISKPESRDTSYLLALMATKDEPAFAFSDTVLTLMQRCSSYVSYLHPDVITELEQTSLIRRRVEEWFGTTESPSTSFDTLSFTGHGVSYRRRLRTPYFYLGEYARKHGVRVAQLTEFPDEYRVRIHVDENDILSAFPEYQSHVYLIEYLLDAYKNGDLDAMQTRWLRFRDASVAAYLNDVALPTAVQSVHEYHQENPVFVSMPALLMGGRNGVLAQLRKRGYVVETLANGQNAPTVFPATAAVIPEAQKIVTADKQVRMTLPYELVDVSQRTESIKDQDAYFLSVDNTGQYSVEVMYKSHSYEDIYQYADTIMSSLRRRKPNAVIHANEEESDDLKYVILRDTANTPPHIGALFVKTPVSVVGMEFCLPNVDAVRALFESMSIGFVKPDSAWFEHEDSASRTKCMLPGRVTRRSLEINGVRYSTNTLDIHARQVDYEIFDSPRDQRAWFGNRLLTAPDNVNDWPMRVVGNRQVFEHITDKSTTAVVFHGTTCHSLRIHDKRDADVIIIDRWVSSLVFDETPPVLAHTQTFPSDILSIHSHAAFTPVTFVPSGSSRGTFSFDRGRGIIVTAVQMARTKLDDLSSEGAQSKFMRGLGFGGSKQKYTCKPIEMPSTKGWEFTVQPSLDSLVYVVRVVGDSISQFHVTIQGAAHHITPEYLTTFWEGVVVHRDTTAQALLYRITKPGVTDTSYLFGTMHLRDRRVFAFGDSVLPALRRCKVFASETDIDSAWMTIVADVIAHEQAAELEAKPDKSDDELVNWVRSQNNDETDSTSPGSGPYFKEYPAMLDLYLELTAASLGLKTVGLEPASSSGVRYKNWSDGNIPDLLFGEEGDDGDETAFIDVYRKGDVDELYDTASSKLGLTLNKTLLVDRNQVMANAFYALQGADEGKSPGGVFVAVGAGHLGGDEGLISLLSDKGYRVERVLTTHRSPLPPVNIIISHKLNWITSKDGVVSAILPFRPMNSSRLDSLIKDRETHITLSASCDQFASLLYDQSVITKEQTWDLAATGSSPNRVTHDTTIAGFPAILSACRLRSGSFDFGVCVRMPTSYLLLRTRCDDPQTFKEILGSIDIRYVKDTAWTIVADTTDNFSFSSLGKVEHQSLPTGSVYTGFGSQANEFVLVTGRRFFNQVDTSFRFADEYFVLLESQPTDTSSTSERGRTVTTHRFAGKYHGILSYFAYRLKVFCLVTFGEGATMESEHNRIMSSINLKSPLRGFQDRWTSPDSVVSTSVHGDVTIDYGYGDSTEYLAYMTDNHRMVLYSVQCSVLDSTYTHEGPLDSLLVHALKYDFVDATTTTLSSATLAGRPSMQIDYISPDSSLRQCQRNVLVGRTIYTFKAEGPTPEVNDTLLNSIWRSITVRDTPIDSSLFVSVLPKLLALCDSLVAADTISYEDLRPLYRVKAFKSEAPKLKAWIDAYFNLSKRKADVLGRVVNLYVGADTTAAMLEIPLWYKKANPEERSEFFYVFSNINSPTSNAFIQDALVRGDDFGQPVNIHYWANRSKWKGMYPRVLAHATKSNSGSTVLNLFLGLVDSAATTLADIEPYLPQLIDKADSLEAALQLRLAVDSLTADYGDEVQHIVAITRLCSRFKTNIAAQRLVRRVSDLPTSWPSVMACCLLIESDNSVDSAQLGRLAVDDTWRYQLLQALEEKGRYSEMPARHRTREALSKAYLAAIEEVYLDSVKIVYEQSISTGRGRGTWCLVEHQYRDSRKVDDSTKYEQLPLEKEYYTVGPFNSGYTTMSLPELTVLYPNDSDVVGEGDFKTQLALMLREFVTQSSDE